MRDRDLPILESRSERRRREKSKRFHDRVRWMGAAGVLAGLSLNSLALAHMTKPTFAMLTDATTEANISFGAATHFPEWYQSHLNQMADDHRQALSELGDMATLVQKIKDDNSRKDALTLLASLTADSATVSGFAADAQAQFDAIDAAYQQAEQSYEAVQKEVAQNDGGTQGTSLNQDASGQWKQYVASWQRVAQVGLSYDQEAGALALGDLTVQAQSDLETAKQDLPKAVSQTPSADVANEGAASSVASSVYDAPSGQLQPLAPVPLASDMGTATAQAADSGVAAIQTETTPANGSPSEGQMQTNATPSDPSSVPATSSLSLPVEEPPFVNASSIAVSSGASSTVTQSVYSGVSQSTDASPSVTLSPTSPDSVIVGASTRAADVVTQSVYGPQPVTTTVYQGGAPSN